MSQGKSFSISRPQVQITPNPPNLSDVVGLEIHYKGPPSTLLVADFDCRRINEIPPPANDLQETSVSIESDCPTHCLEAKQTALYALFLAEPVS